MSTLVAPDQDRLIWAILLAAAAFGVWSERTRVGRRLSGCLVTMGTTFALSNLGVLPAAGAAAYDATWSFLVPLAIPLLLVRADLRRILREAGATLAAFALGALGTAIGTVVAFEVVPLGENGWQLAAIFSATYIGGSMNYAAAAEVVGLREGGHGGDLLTAGVAADNLVMALYFLVLFSLPGWRWLAARYPRRASIDLASIDRAVPSTDVAETAGQPGPGQLPSVLVTIVALAASAAICATGFLIADGLGWQGGGVLVLTALTVAMATAAPRAMARCDGADRLGMLLMQVFFAVIGASANVAVVFRVGPMLFVFAALILSIHLVVLLLAGRLFRLDLRELLIASNANMGGPTTAAAMAAANRWPALVMPAILCGTLGYAFATFAGVALGNWLR